MRIFLLAEIEESSSVLGGSLRFHQTSDFNSEISQAVLITTALCICFVDVVQRFGFR